MLPTAAAVLSIACVFASIVSADPCLGEFELCPTTGECTLYNGWCGTCTAGQYVCPDGKTCVSGASGYLNCPGLAGTHLDWTLPAEVRLDFLVSAATESEKIAQLTNDAPELSRLGIPAYNWLNDDEHGVQGTFATIFPDGCGLGASWDSELLQQVGLAVGMEARGLHNGFVHEGNRGHNQNGRGITMYAPNMNLVRDPRWGRAQEVYSEDPYLSAQLTYQFVSGGQNLDGPYMLAGACCKHYAAYDVESLPEKRYYFSATVDARNMWETYLPVFRACVVGAEGMHVMCSYNAINGVPTCAEPRLLNGILRDQWNWDGFVVSDYDAWAQIKDTHQYCPDYTCAAAAGINAGMDQEGGGTAAIDQLSTAITQGMVTNSTLDVAFRRLFRARIKLGMLDPPTLVPWNTVDNTTNNVESAQHMELARLAAREAMCLYKNAGDTLPLDAGANQKIALIGPQVPQEFLLLGNYAQYPTSGVTSVLEGVLRATGQNSSTGCTYEPDIDYYIPGQTGLQTRSPEECCYVCSSNATCHYWTWYQGECYQKPDQSGRVSSPGRISGSCSPTKISWSSGCMDGVLCLDTSGFGAAIEAAVAADVVIVTLGLSQDIEREGTDRADIALPTGQYELVSSLRQAIGDDKPLIGVLIHGGTIAMYNLYEQLDAIVDAWYPGVDGGSGLADVLFAVNGYSPAGRTPVTYYPDNSQLPAPGLMDLYAGVNGSLGLTYRFYTSTPTYPFGYGLSYTTFRYSGLSVNGSSFGACDKIGVSVTVTNTGTQFTSDEVVQLYVKQPDATVPVPNVRLADFKRVHDIAPGSSRVVHLTITPEFRSAVYNNVTTTTVDASKTGTDSPNIYDGSAVMIEAGMIEIYVGGGQPQYYDGELSASVRITETAPLNSCLSSAFAF